MKVHETSKLFLFTVITTKSDILCTREKASHERLFANRQKSSKHNCTHRILWSREMYLSHYRLHSSCISEAHCYNRIKRNQIATLILSFGS